MLIGRTIKSSRCGRPRWYRIRVITGKPCRGEPIPRIALIRKYGGPPKIKPQAQFLREVKFLPVPVGLTWKHDILVLKPTPCLPNGNEVDDWMGLDERNSWFKYQVRDSNRSQDIVNLNKFKKFKTVKNYGRK
ncbi:uncharacterized protein TNCV_3232341 [Trichonephila clavipes]|nr:uncharacterized protein TNCV_3232341 [Trichonephila clavipes]